MNNLLTQLNILGKSRDDKEIYKLITEQLKHESNDLEFWLSLAIAIVYPPFGDEEKSIKFINKALAIDHNNPIALIVLAHVYEYELGGIDDILLHQIKNLHTASDEINSMLKYVASWSYSYTKKQYYDLEEELLKESIKLCDKHVWNYYHLARLYVRQERYLEVNSLIKKALSNVKKIYTSENINEYQTTSITDFINSRIKGTHITDINVETIQENFIPKHIIFFYMISTPCLRLYNFIKTKLFQSMNLE